MFLQYVQHLKSGILKERIFVTPRIGELAQKNMADHIPGS